MVYKKRMILDSDGGDSFLARGASYEEFTAMRLTPIIGSGITTIFACGYDNAGYVSYENSAVAYTKREAFVPTFHSPLPDMYREGGDPVQYTLRFCRQHGLEYFFGFRMNDMHDSATGTAVTHNQWKIAHRDCMFAPDGSKPPYGGAYGLNYRCDAVREILLGVTEEVCARFDIDGIYYDFFRHPVFFPSVAYNGQAEPEDVACMTGFMQEARRIINEAGRRRGRKIEFAIRTPDSLPYCLQLGMDLEAWMREGLIDTYLPASYIQINFWEYSAELGHKYGINVYPSIDESRVATGTGGRRNPVNLRRNNPIGMRGRIRNTQYAGCDGFMLFNYYFAHRTAEYRENILLVTDPTIIAHGKRRYALSPRGDVGVPHTVPPEYRALMKVPTLSESMPLSIDGTYTADYYMAEPSHEVEGTMRLYFREPCSCTVRLNDVALPGTWEGNIFVAPVPGAVVMGGINRFCLHTDGPAVCTDVTLDITEEL